MKNSEATSYSDGWTINEQYKHDNKWKRGTKYPRTGGMGENNPFTVQSRKKERENGHDIFYRSKRDPNYDDD